MTKSVARIATSNQQSSVLTSDDNVPGTIVSSLSKQRNHGVHKAMVRNCECVAPLKVRRQLPLDLDDDKTGEWLCRIRPCCVSSYGKLLLGDIDHFSW